MRRHIILLLALLACRRGPSAADTTALAPGVTRGPVLAGFRNPESATFDSAGDAWFVSNIAGDAAARDHDGFIARVPADGGAVDSLHFVAGGRGGAVLHAPKGMAVAGDTLWVADVDALRGFDRRTGAPVATVELASLGARFLNDVAVAPDGALYVTDTRANRVFRVQGRTAAVALSTPALGGPNGIAWDGAHERFVIVSFLAHEILGWAPGDTSVVRLAEGPGSFDGVQVLGDGRLLVSSWADSTVSAYTVADSSGVAGATPVVSRLESPADIGWDAKRRRLAVPLFDAGRVELYVVP